MECDVCGVCVYQGAAANPDSEEQQQKLREAAEGLRMATNAAAQNAIKKRLVNKLEVRTEPHKPKPSPTVRCDREVTLVLSKVPTSVPIFKM